MLWRLLFFFFFFFNDTATTEIYTLSLHDALPIWSDVEIFVEPARRGQASRELRRGKGEEQSGHVHRNAGFRSEEHTSELQSRLHLVCRLLLEKKKKNNKQARKCVSYVGRRVSRRS